MMLQAYIDESESVIAHQPLLILAGYLADERDWISFNEAWRAEVCGRYGIPYLHAKELRSQNGRLYRHLDLSTRRELIQVASEIIGRFVNSGAIVYMRPSDWKRATTREQRAEWGSAYGICMELLLKAFDDIVASSERVSIFLEGGHANATDAITKIRNCKFDTEPTEFPEMAHPIETFEPLHPELKARETMMRIGDVALVSKSDSTPAQASDLLAYLVGAAVKHQQHAVFGDILDKLLAMKPHRLSGWGPSAVSELVRLIETVQADREELRIQNWEMKRTLRSMGMKVFQLPWGLAIDKDPGDHSAEFKNQVDSILAKLKGI